MYYKKIRDNKDLTYEEIAFLLLKRSCASARQRGRSIKGFYKEVRCLETPKVLCNLLKSKQLFWGKWVKLTEKFVKNGYCDGDRPTLDRIDKNGHYQVDNIQALSKKNNIIKDQAYKCIIISYNEEYEFEYCKIIWGTNQILKELNLTTSKQLLNYKSDSSIAQYIHFISEHEELPLGCK